MAACGLLLTVLLLVLANEVSSSNTRKSGLTLDLCGSLQASKEIIINIVAQNGETRQAKITGDGNTKQYKVCTVEPRYFEVPREMEKSSK